MRESTSERIQEDIGEIARGAHRAIGRTSLKSPSMELRRLVIAAAAALPAGRSWWAERKATPGGVVRA
jgi:hypothetical protein